MSIIVPASMNSSGQFPYTSNVVIVGGMSFHGAMIANYLYKSNCYVTVIEDSINIEPVPIKWYRWTYLPVHKEFVDFSHNINKLKRVLKTSRASSVLYVPTGIIDTHDPARVNQVGVSTMVHFQKLLSIASKVPSVKQIILLSTVDKGSDLSLLHKTWMSNLEQMLIFFYRQIKGDKISIALIKVNGVFGPSKEITESTDKCWYIDSVADLVYNVTSTFMSGFTMKDLTAKCEHDVTHGIAVTERWIKDYKIYLKKQTRNVVLGAVIVYESKAKWWAGSARSNDHNYLKSFVLSAMKLQKVDILIIHNSLTSNFTQKYEKACPSCHFVKYSPVNKRTAHDQRFYMTYDYLLKSPDISNFVTADLRDVVFYSDPFKIMDEIGDYFYVGYDIPFRQYLRNMSWPIIMLKKCYPLIKLEDEVYDLYGGFNSGVMGGSRHVMLTLLSRIILYLDIASINGVCDMVTANAVYHLQDYERIYAGYPFTGSFMIRISGPQGCAIKHKPYH